MKKIIKYISWLLPAVLFASCTSLFNPLDENITDEEYTINHPEGAEGLLLQAISIYSNTCCWNNGNSTYYLCTASDEAVSNKSSSNINRVAKGELTPAFNPIGDYRWRQSYRAITYINKFLSMVEKVKWHTERESANNLFIRRLTGEALALRAMLHQNVLECFAGKGTDGQMYGVPYYDRFLSESQEFQDYQRLPFEKMVERINRDYKQAYEYLPYAYSDKAEDILDKDKSYDAADWFLVNGKKFKHRINAEIVRALQARLMLMAGSEAYAVRPGLTREYNERAAAYAADVLGRKDYKLASSGVEFYNDDGDLENPEILWRQSKTEPTFVAEQEMFMPSLNGEGGINPTQNFVDAFPMKDGYPISESDQYDPQNPYKDRDPRLGQFVIYDGCTFKGSVVNITPSNPLDGLNNVAEQSTRTGYYLKKLLRSDVNIPVAGVPVARQHVIPFIRYTEIFLILAEAQNEIGGPDYKTPGCDYSARDIIRMIRQRGIGISVDSYLDAIAGKEAMMKLIQNERRIELSFEGFRFWDMRRWNLPLDENIRGYYKFDESGYKEFIVEEHPLSDEKYRYMPLLRNDIRKYHYVQNRGW